MTGNSFDNILVVAAHPDDEVLGCGGTIARLAAENRTVRILLLADGVGSRHSGASAETLAEVARRQTAARKAAEILGASSVAFGDFPDNRLDSIDRLTVTQAVEEFINQYTPDAVLTHHAGDLNVDHRRAHEAVVTACRPQPGHSVRTILFFETASSTEWQMPGLGTPFSPNWFFDISQYMGAKRAALTAYEEEMRAWPHARSLEAVEHLAHWRGSNVGVVAAEAFILGRNIVGGRGSGLRGARK